MEKLKIEHLAPYLPYGLKVLYLENEKVELVGFNRNTIYHTTGFFVELPCNLKPILRPLSDLNKEEMSVIREIGLFKVENQQWTKQHWDFIKNVKSFPLLQKYRIVEKLFSWHFDVFGLIDKNLAIDINTI